MIHFLNATEPVQRIKSPIQANAEPAEMIVLMQKAILQSAK